MRQVILTCWLSGQLMICATPAAGQSPDADAAGQQQAIDFEKALAADWDLAGQTTFGLPNQPHAGLVGALTAGVSLAAFEEGDKPSHSSLIHVGVAGVFPRIDGHMNLEDFFGFATSLDLDSDLGVSGAEDILMGEIGLTLGRHEVRVSGFSFEATGSQRVERNITFGDLVIPVGDVVRTDIDLDNIKVQYRYSFFTIKDHGFQLGPVIGLDYFHLDASLEATGLGMKESIDEHIPIPMIGLHAALPIEKFLISADVSGLYLSIRDIEGSFIETSATIGWYPLNNVGIFAGYRLIHFDLSGSDFDFDASLQGPFFGAEIRF